MIYILAALAYNVMPINGMASEGMIHQHSMIMDMSQQAMNSVSPVQQDHGGCTGQHGEKHTGTDCCHCAACLTLPATLMGFGAQPVMRTAPMPGLGAPLLSQTNMPLVPPPRS